MGKQGKTKKQRNVQHQPEQQQQQQEHGQQQTVLNYELKKM